MAFKSPAVSPLTDGQEQLLAQLGSIKNILTVPTKKNQSIPENKQISTFDYLVRIAETTVGSAFINIMLTKFVNEIFDLSTDKLEKAIIKGIAKSLDKQNKHISQVPTESNHAWLTANVLPALHTTMTIIKAVIVKHIVAMIFGPKTVVKHDTTLADANGIIYDPNLPNENQILDDILAADSMFSISNADSNQFGDQDYNLVTLRERLEKGQVMFTISCQDVKISLPNNFNTEADNIINNVINTAGVTIPGQPVPNPAQIFGFINNHVGSETGRINTQENKNAIRKSFLQILVEKTLNLIMIAIAPYLMETVNRINAENPTLNLTIIGLIGTPKILKDLSESDPAQFDTQKEFMATFINALYAILLSIILKTLIKEIKKLIKNAIAKKASTRAASKFKRLAQIKNGLENASDIAEKSKNAANALKEFVKIFNYSENNNA